MTQQSSIAAAVVLRSFCSIELSALKFRPTGTRRQEYIIAHLHTVYIHVPQGDLFSRLKLGLEVKPLTLFQPKPSITGSPFIEIALFHQQ